VDAWADYVLVAGLRESDGSASVHAFCLPEYHQYAGCNVLFLDGSVQWYEKKVFAKLMRHPELFFATSNQVQLAELKARTHINWPTHHIVRKCPISNAQ
jgi:prepilin-type processing-associated H-X9-DG protein